MTRHYCTYFDRRYAAQGLVMLRSLHRHDPGCECLVWALDIDAYRAVERAAMPGVVVELVPAEGAESIWRLTPRIMQAGLLQWGEVAYCDADLYWFADPAPLYAVAGSLPAAIIPHNWTPKYAERLRPNGVYNVGWLRLCGDGGRHIASNWGRWCDTWRRTPEHPRFMDQPYLDDWPGRYGAAVVRLPGANLAPYNQEQYTYPLPDPGLIFYHFHEFRWRSAGEALHVYRTGYPLHPWVRDNVYPEYERQIAATIVNDGRLVP